MSLTNKTYAPVLSITVKATQNLSAFRFIGYNGALSGAGDKALGVTDTYHPLGDNASITVIGLVLVEAGGNISAGDDISSGTSGKAVVSGANDIVNGSALDSGSSGDLIRVLLR